MRFFPKPFRRTPAAPAAPHPADLALVAPLVEAEHSAHRTATLTPAPPVDQELVIEIVGVKRTILRAVRLLLETVIVPTVLLAVLLPTAGLVVAMSAALGWCYLAVAVRWIRGGQMPGTMLLAVSMLSGRAAIALATSSAFVYLLQPALGSAVMALLFVGSALIGRPITLKLARDFVHVPHHVIDRKPVRVMFVQVALLWGLGRLVDAGMSLAFLHTSVNAGLLSRGVFSPLLTVLTVAVCALWGWRALRRDGVKLRLRPAHLPTPAEVATV